DARARPPGCVPGRRPGAAEGAADGRLATHVQGIGCTRRGLAAVARVCRDPSVEGRDGARRHRTPHATGARRNATRSRATRNRRGKPMTITFLQTDTPIGVLTLAADND